MLSLLDEEQLRKPYPRQELPRLTTNSIASISDLETELDEIRHRRYSTSPEASEDGVTSVAVALAGPSGAVYGINDSVPMRLTTQRGTMARCPSVGNGAKNQFLSSPRGGTPPSTH